MVRCRQNRWQDFFRRGVIGAEVIEDKKSVNQRPTVATRNSPAAAEIKSRIAIASVIEDTPPPKAIDVVVTISHVVLSGFLLCPPRGMVSIISRGFIQC